MKINLINPPQLNVLDNRQYPPLGLMYIASYLREKGYGDVSITDLGGMQEKEWKKHLVKADVYGFTCFSPSFHYVKKLSRITKELNPDCVNVIGGNHPSALPEETAKLNIFDYVVVGEGEEAFLKIIKNVENRKKLEKIIKCDFIENLDVLPLPARDLVDLKSYSAKLFGKPATGIMTGRSCPYNCAFCSKAVFQSKLRIHSPEYVIKEVKSIIDSYGIRHFNLFDDVFIMNRPRLHKILAGFKKLNIKFLCQGRANLNTYKDFVKLKEAGCVKVGFGIESGSQKVLDLNNKQVTVKQNKEAIINAKKAGLIVKAFFVFGLPGEDEKSVEETKKFIEEADPHQANLYTFIPFPGTAIWNNPKKYGVKFISKNFDDYYVIGTDGRGGVNIEYENLSKEKFLELREDLLKFVKSREDYKEATESTI